jgi:hypothetical protein
MKKIKTLKHRRRKKLMRKALIIIASILLLSVLPYENVLAKNNSNKGVQVPNSTVNISKENTYPNPTQDLPYLQPSKLAKTLLNTVDVKIENSTLIRMLNESSISSTPFALGYNATIYLGLWPLSYESKDTSVNWEYKKTNVNRYDNRGGKMVQKVYYVQEQEAKLSGGLTAKTPHSDEVKKMMMQKASTKTGLPLSFETVVGKGTKKEDQVYNVQPKKLGYIYSYVPAVNEKGKITYGEVYLVLKGNKKKIEVRNVTQQGIGAWIPVQDHISLKFIMSSVPQ